jgi:hypothetical protein
MPLPCNIDARGKLIRLIYGAVLFLAGIVLVLAWAIPAGRVVPWVVSIGLTVSGAFAIFESRAGWCAIRALGIKTPI